MYGERSRGGDSGEREGAVRLKDGRWVSRDQPVIAWAWIQAVKVPERISDRWQAQ